MANEKQRHVRAARLNITLHKLRKTIVKTRLRYLKNHLQGVGTIGEERIYSTFSGSYGFSILAFAGAFSYLVLRSREIIPPLIIKWVEVFQIHEIFNLELIEVHIIQKIYLYLILSILVLVDIQLLLKLIRLPLCAMILLPDRLVAVESNLLKVRIHHIPYSKILRISGTVTIVQRIFKLGNIEIFTGERDKPLKFGPLPAFPIMLSRITYLIRKR